jgi:hypothetical protein
MTFQAYAPLGDGQLPSHAPSLVFLATTIYKDSVPNRLNSTATRRDTLLSYLFHPSSLDAAATTSALDTALSCAALYANIPTLEARLRVSTCRLSSQSGGSRCGVLPKTRDDDHCLLVL